MSTVIRPYTLPSAMAIKMRQIRRRQIFLTALRALAVGAAALIVAMLTAMLVDWWFTLFHPGVRTALTAASLIAAVAALLPASIRPMVRAWRWTHVATSADEEVPQLEQRWTTIASVAQANHQPTSRIARAMLEQVTSEAVAMQSLVRPNQVARPMASLRAPALLLVSCGALLAGFLVVDWPQTSVLLRRFWSPRTPITATQLRSMTRDQFVPRGESLDLVTHLSGLPRRTATLELATGAEIVDEFVLKPDPLRTNAFVHRLSVEQSFRYRVRAGDDRTAWHTVTAIDYPALAEVQFTVTPPDYVARPEYQKPLIPSRVTVVQGSRLKLRMKPVEPLERLDLALAFEPAATNSAPRRQALALTAEGDGWYQFEMQLLENVSLRPTLRNRHGLTNEDKHLCRIQVVADKAPVARILKPTEEMVVAPDNVIDIEFEAHDDHGIATAELVVYDESEAADGKEPKVLAIQKIPLGQQQPEQHVRASTKLDLNQLWLDEGANISFAIRVTDNRQVTYNSNDTANQLAEARPRNAADAPMSGALAANKDDGEKRTRSPQPPVGGASPEQGELRTKVATAANSASEAPQKPTGPAPKAEHEASLAAASKAEAASLEDAARKLASTPQKPSVDPDKPSEADPSDAYANNPPERAGSLATAPSGQERSPLSVAGPENDDSQSSPESDPAEETPPATPQVSMSAQQSETGQNAETSRQKLKIAQTLAAAAIAAGAEPETMAVRQRVVRIDEMLSVAEKGLNTLVEREVPDAERGAQFRRLDVQLGDIEAEISSLRNETKEHQHAFVGLQMVDIGRSHVTPARERTFIGIREPLAAENATVALQQMVRARELLAALLKRYDRAEREQQLAQGLDEAVEMYEVYVEKMQQLMREARQNKNPLERKMAVIEVDQTYLDRYAEVLTLRREMMAEFARLLGDDPRLLARYLDLTKRRRESLRDQLSELAERQDELATELSGWREVDSTQRDVLWRIVAEMRLYATAPLAKDAAALAEGIEKQLPLLLESDRGTSALVVEQAQQIARLARQITFDVKKFPRQGEEPSKAVDLTPSAEQLAHLCGELAAALDQLNFEHEDEADVTNYVTSRLLELRAVADQADAWLQICGHLHHQRYHGLAEIDQHRLAIATELLRVEMLDIEEDLQNQFQQQAENSVPSEIIDLIRQLQGVMEEITFHQAAATFAMTQNRLETASLQQSKGVQKFERAGILFDQMRRAVVAALDEYDTPDPNIADLVDPTLDEFLAHLEREPNIEAQLGIPNRPRNLRAIADSMAWQEQGAGLLGQSSEAPAMRSRQTMRDKVDQAKRPETPERELTDAERQQRREAQQMQQELEKSLASIEAKANDPNTPAEQRRQWEQMAENMKQLLARNGQADADAEQWERIAAADQARGILQSLARGEKLPDEQWNKLLSTLDDGLWQVRDRTPPEEYRKSIEQYQETLRQLEGGGGAGE